MESLVSSISGAVLREGTLKPELWLTRPGHCRGAAGPGFGGAGAAVGAEPGAGGVAAGGSDGTSLAMFENSFLARLNS